MKSRWVLQTKLRALKYYIIIERQICFVYRSHLIPHIRYISRVPKFHRTTTISVCTRSGCCLHLKCYLRSNYVGLVCCLLKKYFTFTSIICLHYLHTVTAAVVLCSTNNVLYDYTSKLFVTIVTTILEILKLCIFEFFYKFAILVIIIYLSIIPI